MKTDILKTAEELLNGDRSKSYGEPVANFENVAIVANVLLKRKNIDARIKSKACRVYNSR